MEEDANELKRCYKELFIKNDGKETNLEDVSEYNKYCRRFLSACEPNRRFHVLNFYWLIWETFKSATHPSDVKFLEGLKVGFSSLEKYAVNLIKYPWRREFHTIKLYTGFYKYYVESKIVPSRTVLEQMGYTGDGELEVKLKDPPRTSELISLAFELNLANVEVAYLSDLVQMVGSKGYSTRQAIHARQFTRGDEDMVCLFLGSQVKELREFQEPARDLIKDDVGLQNEYGLLVDNDIHFPKSSQIQQDLHSPKRDTSVREGAKKRNARDGSLERDVGKKILSEIDQIESDVRKDVESRKRDFKEGYIQLEQRKREVYRSLSTPQSSQHFRGSDDQSDSIHDRVQEPPDYQIGYQPSNVRYPPGMERNQEIVIVDDNLDLYGEGPGDDSAPLGTESDQYSVHGQFHQKLPYTGVSPYSGHGIDYVVHGGPGQLDPNLPYSRVSPYSGQEIDHVVHGGPGQLDPNLPFSRVSAYSGRGIDHVVHGVPGQLDPNLPYSRVNPYSGQGIDHGGPGQFDPNLQYARDPTNLYSGQGVNNIAHGGSGQLDPNLQYTTVAGKDMRERDLYIDEQHFRHDDPRNVPVYNGGVAPPQYSDDPSRGASDGSSAKPHYGSASASGKDGATAPLSNTEPYRNVSANLYPPLKHIQDGIQLRDTGYDRGGYVGRDARNVDASPGQGRDAGGIVVNSREGTVVTEQTDTTGRVGRTSDRNGKATNNAKAQDFEIIETDEYYQALSKQKNTYPQSSSSSPPKRTDDYSSERSTASSGQSDQYGTMPRDGLRYTQYDKPSTLDKQQSLTQKQTDYSANRDVQIGVPSSVCVCRFCYLQASMTCIYCKSLSCETCGRALSGMPCPCSNGANHVLNTLHSTMEQQQSASSVSRAGFDKEIPQQNPSESINYRQRCSHCSGQAYLFCKLCNALFCNVCTDRFKEEKCVISEEPHQYSNIPLLSKENVRLAVSNSQGKKTQNKCEFCVRPSSVICKHCYKICCGICKDEVFAQDLCGRRKSSHEFILLSGSENANKQTAGSNEDWKCARCTLVNPAENNICCACAATKGAVIEGPEIGGLQCVNCTFINKEDAKICDMCLTPIDQKQSYV